jgi:hypothetical protein
MLITQFVEQNIHFAINLFAALVFFAVFWLHFDAWLGQTRKSHPETLKWIGFLLASLSFIPAATLVEQIGQNTLTYGNAASLLSVALRIIGYVLIIISQLIDPLQAVPIVKSLEEQYAESHPPLTPAPTTGTSPPATSTLGVFGLGSTTAAMIWALPLGALGVAALYWRRATTGLERHLRPVAIAFFFLFLFELCSLGVLLRSTTNPSLYDLVKAFGPLWFVGQGALLVGVTLLGRWVWQYLTERFMSQLFMTFTTVVLGVFLLTTVSFTFLLLQNIQNSALDNLATATNVLNYALESRKSSAQANAEALAASPAIAQSVANKDHKSLISLTGTFLENKQLSSLVITTADGQVLLRAEDPARWGDSISSDTLLRRALVGTSSSTVESQDAVLAPVLSIRSVVPIRDSSNTIIGTVSVSTIINSAFLDGVKHATGLDAAIYSSNVRSATTFTAPDGISRWVGVRETSTSVQQTVLKQGHTYKGQLNVLNRQYLAVYAPLKDADNAIIGMLFIGTPEYQILQTTASLVNLTFIVAAALLIVSIIPAYLIASHITKQLE